MRTTLLEAEVLNLPRVERYAKILGRRVGFQAGAGWLEKRIRQMILNGGEMFLYRLAPHEIPPNASSYVKAAVERNEPVYEFNTDSDALETLENQSEIIIDWLVGLNTAATQEANENQLIAQNKILATKTLAKLDRYTWTQALQAAQDWANSAIKRSLKLHKDGGEVIYEWSDGYYAIRFTDQNTMKRDGAQLQNCLAQGMYWNNVQNGSQMVIAIRKPNDEAVVGLRFNSDGSENIECKGKNNKPVTNNYVQYVVDLLAALGTKNESYDITAAGISLNKYTGQYGSFKDIADKVYNKDGITVYETSSVGIVEVGKRNVIEYSLRDGVIHSLKRFGVDNRNDLIKYLNIIGRDAASQIQSDLMMVQGIYNRDKKWGDITLVGKFGGEFPTVHGRAMKVWQVGDNENGHVIIQVSSGEEGTLVITNGRVTSGDRYATGNEKYLAEVFNSLNLKGSDIFEDEYIHKFGYAYDGKKYVDVVSERPAAALERYPTDQGQRRFFLYKVPNNKNVWLISNLYDKIAGNETDERYSTIRIRAGVISPDYVRNHGKSACFGAIAWLIENNHAKTTENVEMYGIGQITNDDGAKIAAKNPMDVINALKKIPNHIRAQWPLVIYGEDPTREVGSTIRTQRYLDGMQKFGKLTPEVQRGFVSVLAPEKSFTVKERETYKFHDVNLKNIEITLPSMLMHFLNGGYLTDPVAKKKAEEVRARIEKDVTEFLQKNNDAHFEGKGEWPWGDFNDFIYDQNLRIAKLVAKAKQDTINNKNVSLEDKFAALNTNRKLNGKF